MTTFLNNHEFPSIVHASIIETYSGNNIYFYRSTDEHFHTSDELGYALGWREDKTEKVILSWTLYLDGIGTPRDYKERQWQLYVMYSPAPKDAHRRRILYILNKKQTKQLIDMKATERNNQKYVEAYERNGLEGVIQARRTLGLRSNYLYLFVDMATMDKPYITLKMGIVNNPSKYLKRIAHISGRHMLKKHTVSDTQFITEDAEELARNLIQKYKLYEITANWFEVPKEMVDTIAKEIQYATLARLEIEPEQQPVCLPMSSPEVPENMRLTTECEPDTREPYDFKGILAGLRRTVDSIA
jgi:hypothetical protein